MLHTIAQVAGPLLSRVTSALLKLLVILDRYRCTCFISSRKSGS